MSTKKNWIKVSTAARLKGVKRQAIYYHIKEGNLGSFELDGNVYVDRDEVVNLKPKGKGEYRKRNVKSPESTTGSSPEPPVSKQPKK